MQVTSVTVSATSSPTPHFLHPSAAATAAPSSFGYGVRREICLTTMEIASIEATRRRLLLHNVRSPTVPVPAADNTSFGSSSVLSDYDAASNSPKIVVAAPDGDTVASNGNTTNFHCNDLECSLRLSDYAKGFLGNFLSKGLKTNQLVVNTDEKTLRPIARLKEPRDLFALPKDKDNDCSQQAPRWPVECQVIGERIVHIPYVPAQPEPLNVPTGNELKPRPVGEENGIVVFNYCPISAVNYENKNTKAKTEEKSSEDSDDSSDSRNDVMPLNRRYNQKAGAKGQMNRISKIINSLDDRSTSNSQDDDDDDDDCDTSSESREALERLAIQNLIDAKKKRLAIPTHDDTDSSKADSKSTSKDISEIEDIWKNNSTEYKPASPNYVLSQFGKKVSKAIIEKFIDHDEKPSSTLASSSNANKFSRSAVGGAKFVTNCHPMNAEDYDSLEFESRFESGNLAKAVQITPTYYELYLRPDLYTSRSKQWFYFRVRRTRRNMLYRFSIVNLVKSDSLYNDGMRPVMYSTLGAKEKNEGWRRCGNNISYYRNDDESNNSTNEEDEDNSSYTLTFTIEFEHDDDTVYFAHSYPYTYSDLQDYLMEIQRHPVKSKFCKLRLLCRTLAGNNVYYLTVTAPSSNDDNTRRKKSIVVSARVHPSETPSSWMMKGLMDFITGDTTVAKRLRHKFIFKLVPMLNPDGVIVGNTRNSLTGKDLNRQYRTVIRETYPSIWYTKAMIRRLIEECGVAMYCDMHAHSRKHNIFIYGCENKRNPEKRLTEQVFPLMLHKNSADRFSFESCKFKIQRSKEGTGRIVVWMLGITNSYTIEASFGGSSLGSRKGTHFSTQDYEHMGRAFCETLLDYCDENPNKERLRSKIIERLMREGSSADEPLNIPLSDYSSDEGNCSSSSDNEGKHSITASDLEGPCCAPIRAPPSSPEVMHEIRKFRIRRMHKVMRVLDQIYFSPVLQRKFKALSKLKRRKQDLAISNAKQKQQQQQRASGGGGGTAPRSPSSDTQQRAQITTKQIQINESPSSNGSQPSDLVRDTSSTHAKPAKNKNKVQKKQQRATQTRKRCKHKKKRMPTEKGKAKAINRKTRIDRNLRLWLANRRIFIFRRKKSRRQRVRSKPLKKRGEVVRTALDLPTTDPGSDLHFSTDDEELMPTGNVAFGAVAPLRHTLLQSDLQRRYIEEIGDMVVQKPKPAHMPPELIVTTPSKSCGQGGAKKLEVYKLTPRTAPEQQQGVQLLHGQSNVTAARRTYSWHSLNQDSAHSRTNFIMNETKPPVKIHKQPPRRVPSNFIPLGQQRHTNADDLHLKLSLKKKIWTGAHGDNDGRPLAWYKGHQSQAHVANVMANAAAMALRGPGGAQTRNMFAGNNSNSKDIMPAPATGAGAGAATAAATLPPSFMGAQRRTRKLEQVDLFNACSQKLLLWQQEHKKILPSNARLVGGNSAKLDAQEAPPILLRGCKPKKNVKAVSNSNEMVHVNVSGVSGKGKRKSSMIKIAETTQLVTRFSRSHASAGANSGNANGNQQMTQMQRLMFKNNEQNHAATASGMQRTTSNKFKTGGIVVTAVQQSASNHAAPGAGISRRMRHTHAHTHSHSHGGHGHTHSSGLHIKGSCSGPNDNILQYRNSNSLQVNKSTVGGFSMETVSLVRKVKTKLKKRKSRTLANSTAAASK